MGQRQSRVISPTQVGLKAGDRGPAVGELQRYLARFGYLPVDASLKERLRRSRKIEVSEVFDDETAEALRAFQSFSRLPVTGRLDDLTVGEMALARCGVPDVWRAEDLVFGQVRFVLSGSRWKTRSLRYGFTNYSSDSTRIRINRAVSAAFRAWSDVVPLTFQRVAAIQDDTEIRIQFAEGDHGDGANNAFDGADGVLAHAYYPPSGGVDGSGGLSGDVHFDDAETWNTAAVVPAGTYDLQSVATHEIGHALGLEHSSEPGAIMWRSTSPGTPKRTLHQDDIDGILEIYGLRRVPFVLESPVAAAAATVRAARLNPVFTGSTGRDAWVWRQSPRAGQQVDTGSTVTMQLRTGPIP